jgi:hypothetical protein
VNTASPIVAVVQGLLISPAALFMGALVVRTLPPPQSDLVLNAERIVMWYAARQWTLWVLLIVLPLAVLVAGCHTLLSARRIHPDVATTSVATATLMAGGVLTIVTLHMLAN